MDTTTFKVTEDLLAPQGRRLANYIIDLAVQYALVFGIAIILLLIAEFFESPALGSWIESWNSLEEYLVGILMVILYYSTMEVFFSQSIGKFLTKTIVVLEDGTRPDSGTIIKRTFCRLIPFNHFSFLSTPPRGWHDSISKTYVVNKKELEERMSLHYAFEQIGQPTT